MSKPMAGLLETVRRLFLAATRRPPHRQSADPLVQVNAALKVSLERAEAAEAQLRLKQGVLDTVANMAHIGSWELDVASGTTTWSSEVFRIYGIDPPSPPHVEEALRFFPPEAQREIRAAIDVAIDRGTPFDVTTRFVNASGCQLWVRALGMPERVDGKTTRLTGAFQDVTEIYEVQARLARTVRGTQDGIWEQDLASGLMWVSPRFCELVEYELSDTIDGRDVFAKILHPEDRASLERARAAHLESHTPFDVDVRVRRRDGTHRWFRVRASAQHIDSTASNMLSGSIRDITRERETAVALRAANEQAAAASRAKSQFLANMSHEIRTPMNGVLGMTDLLLMTSLDATQIEFAETIRTSATSLITVLNDILDFSKIEAGKLDLECVVFDLRRCVHDAGAMLAAQASAKGIALIVEVDPAVPERVVCDPHRLRQILLNLCGNAVKFTQLGEVALEVHAVSAAAGHCKVRFTVRDTGIGMTTEVLERLFSPFTQADASTTRHFGGTGLGLSIVRQLVQLMGGRIEVTSREGGGSQFSFELSLEVAGATAAESRPAASPASGPQNGAAPAPRFQGHVLLVEDNEVNQQVGRRSLERHGCEVVIAADGRAAIDAWLGGDFELIFMDVQMPLMDGLDATREIRRRERGRARVPIVALTASAMPGELERCVAAGMDGLLTKPLMQDTLRQILERYLCADHRTERHLLTRQR